MRRCQWCKYHRRDQNRIGRDCFPWSVERCWSWRTQRDAQFRVEARSEYVDVREQITVKAALGTTRPDNKTVFLMSCKEA